MAKALGDPRRIKVVGSLSKNISPILPWLA